jgi:ribonuclease Z
MMPMPDRPLTSLAVRTGGAVYLLDCGEGVQVAYKALHVGLRALRLVALTHLHADHCLGVPGLLMLRSQMEDPAPLTVVGPAGIERFIRNVIRDLSCRITFDIRFVEIGPTEGLEGGDSMPAAYEDDLVSLRWLPLRHSVFCVGYRLEEHTRPGEFRPEVARQLGLEPGPDYARLQRGECVTAPGGVLVRPEQVLGEARRGRHVAFCTDTSPCENLVHLLRDVDVAFLEGMFLPEHAEEARQKQHLCVSDAARIAHQAGAQQTILTHLSPRYEAGQIDTFTSLAREVAPNIRAGRDGERIEVELP